MNQGEEQADTHKPEARPAKLLDQRIQQSAKNKFLRHGREDDRKAGQITAHPPRPRVVQELHRRLIVGRIAQPGQGGNGGGLEQPDDREEDWEREQGQEQRLFEPGAVKPEAVTPGDVMMPPKNKSQPARHALKRQRAEQQVSKIIRLPEAADMKLLQTRARQDADADAEKHGGAILEDGFGPPRFD